MAKEIISPIDAINADLSRYYEKASCLDLLEALVRHPGFRFTLWNRMTNYFRFHSPLRILSVFFIPIHFFLKEWTGIQISYSTQIGPGLYIPHAGGIVVNQCAEIGKRLYLSHNVTIGRVHAGKKKGVPIIGDDVFIGPGAVVIGKIRIGDNVAIGPNSVVISDLPDNVFAAGLPAKIVARKSADEILGYFEGKTKAFTDANCQKFVE